MRNENRWRGKDEQIHLRTLIRGADSNPALDWVERQIERHDAMTNLLRKEVECRRTQLAVERVQDSAARSAVISTNWHDDELREHLLQDQPSQREAGADEGDPV